MEDFVLDFEVTEETPQGESIELGDLMSADPKQKEDNNEKPNDEKDEKDDDINNNPDETDDTPNENDSVYSHLAKALREEGIIDTDESFLKEVKDATSFRSMIDNHIQSQISERYKRIESAIENGLKVSDIQVYENQLDWLHSISEEKLTSEDDESFELRKRLIYQDFINKGYSDERARRELKKSMDAGTDIDDAKEALKDGINFVNNLYNQEVEKKKKEKEAYLEEQKKRAKEIEKDIIENNESFGSLNVDKNTRKKIYDLMYKPTVKNKEGKLVSELSDFVKNNNTEAWKYLAYMYNATNKFTNFDGLFKTEVQREVNKGIQNLEKVINSSKRASDGSISFESSDDKDNLFYNNNWDIDL